MEAHPFQVELDRVPHVLFDLLERLAGGDTAGKIGREGRVVVLRSLDNSEF